MLSRATIIFVLLTVSLILTTSCSNHRSGSSDPVIPLLTGSEPGPQQCCADRNHGLWEFDLIQYDADNGEIEIIPLRVVAAHWNVLSFLEQGPCTDCVQISSMSITSSGTLLVDLAIEHPFPLANLTGFDVRGILMFRGSHEFPSTGLFASDASLGDGELLNADGYTTLYNATTTGSGPGGLQGYFQGRLASFQLPTADLSGFIRYSTDDPANTRNAFYSGTSITETYEIDLPDGDFVAGYAVDASWTPPTTKPVTDPMTDFPPEANCPEPWKISISDTPVGDGLTPAGGETVMTIRVDDYGGYATHAAPVVECPELFDGLLTADFLEDGDGYSRWTVTVPNDNLASGGSYSCLVAVEDNENDPGSTPWLDLTAYQVYMLTVDECYDNDPPIASAGTEPDPPVIFPGDTVCFTEGVYDPDGFDDIVGIEWDFSYDAGDGFQSESELDNPWHQYLEEGDYDVQQRVTDRCGNADMLDTPITVHVAHSGWARTWGGSEFDYSYGVATDDFGNVFVTGEFESGFDFDPGPGTDWHDSNGKSDAFICAYDSSGRFKWARTWGGTEYDTGWRVVVNDSGNVYVSATFVGTADLDPGPGIDEHISNGGTLQGDISLSKFNPDGNFMWAISWGGERDDYGEGLGIDSTGDIYVAGTFWGTVDFDPGSGVDDKSAYMNDDCYLSRFNPDGSYEWSAIWGGDYSNFAHDIAIDSGDNVLITGKWGLDVDFDPGSGTETRSATLDDWWQVYLLKLDSSGAFQWVQTWGGDEWEEGRAVAVDGSDNSYVTGFFYCPVDFDPGTGNDTHDTNGNRDVFLSKFDSDGNYQWVGTWGSGARDESYDIVADEYGNVFTVGFFTGLCDFDPGSGTDELDSVAVDAFINIIYTDGTYQWARTWGDDNNDECWAVDLDLSGNIYLTGEFRGTGIDFDPGPESDEHDSAGETDAFLMKLLSNGYWDW